MKIHKHNDQARDNYLGGELMVVPQPNGGFIAYCTLSNRWFMHRQSQTPCRLYTVTKQKFGNFQQKIIYFMDFSDHIYWKFIYKFNLKIAYSFIQMKRIIFFTVYHKLVGPVCIQCTDYENKFWKNLALLIHHCHECQGIKDNDWKLLSYSR